MYKDSDGSKGKMQEVLYIVIPAYNEEDNIKGVIEEWHKIIEKHDGGGKSRLLIVDDGSTDSTLFAARAEIDKHPFLEVITKQNSGHASTCMYGYGYALSHDADFVFQTDSDRQTSTSEFDSFWENRLDNDIVIGYRKKRGDGLFRLLISRMLRLVIAIRFFVIIKDANVPYRLMKREPLANALNVVPTNHELGQILLVVYFKKQKYSMKWISISFLNRSNGSSMYNWHKFIRIGVKAIAEFGRFNHSIFK